ncbi:MAG: 4Fe-4S ferredoxin, partial [Bacteroidales bacterium]|nr:4Fe-4S ferredoxin [Bacteroidales bacterium]
ACLGHCPLGAISIEKREAKAYSETRAMEAMVNKGANTVIAHMKHLKDHDENELLTEASRYLKDNAAVIGFDVRKVISEVNKTKAPSVIQVNAGCPGSHAQSFGNKPSGAFFEPVISQKSELSHWPVQMHLINPSSSHYKNADVLLAADCVAYAVPDFHGTYLRGRKLAIACPKLDQGTDIYIEKIRLLIDEANIRSLHVLVMEVPCCGGLSRMVQLARSQASSDVPVEFTVVNTGGEVIKSINI